MLNQELPSFTWFNSTRVIFGVGVLSVLGQVVRDLSGNRGRLFLVTGRHNLKSRGILQRVIDLIGSERVTLFNEADPFPSPEQVDRALKACRAVSAEIVVSVGGGSAMDLAKSVAILATHDGSAVEYAMGEKQIQRPGLPFIAVPTTSGSSSEVTSGATLWDMENKLSMALGSPLMFPTAAIVDPELTLSMPKTLAAVTGMDAFTSAFESYWSVKAEPITDALNLDVIRLFVDNLERSCLQADLQARSACALAATISGMAYSNSSPNVCHGIGSPLTIFWGVAHGQAVGITLSTFLRWNAPVITHKLPALWDALGVKDLDGAIVLITQLMERCGLETRLQGLGVGQGDLDTLLENIRWDRLESVPRRLNHEDVRNLLSELIA